MSLVKGFGTAKCPQEFINYKSDHRAGVLWQNSVVKSPAQARIRYCLEIRSPRVAMLISLIKDFTSGISDANL